MSEKTIIFYNPSCSKCAEGLDILQNSSCEIQIVEYLKDTPSSEQLKEILELLDIKALDLIRKGEAVFLENFEGKTLSEEQWIQAMLDFPILIERPIVIQGKRAIIGRPPSKIVDFIDKL